MSISSWLDDMPVLAEMPARQAAARLREVGENEVADALEQAAPSGQPSASQVFGIREMLGLSPVRDQAYMHTGYVLGYLPPSPTTNDSLPIYSASKINANLTLKKAPLKITLDRFYVARYPGGGKHRILLHFSTKNQVRGRAKGTEDVHFNATYEVQEGETASVQSSPIFIGLNIGNGGVSFTCFTINVNNEQDRQLLDILNSGVFKAGLKLTSTLQPALAPLSEIATGLVKMMCSRHNNQPVQKFEVGLDFSTIPVRAHLAEGSYIVTQLPADLQRTWNWSDWEYRVDSGLIIKKTDAQLRIPYNYLIFSVSRYQEA